MNIVDNACLGQAMLQDVPLEVDFTDRGPRYYPDIEAVRLNGFAITHMLTSQQLADIARQCFEALEGSR